MATAAADEREKRTIRVYRVNILYFCIRSTVAVRLSFPPYERAAIHRCAGRRGRAGVIRFFIQSVFFSTLPSDLHSTYHRSRRADWRSVTLLSHSLSFLLSCCLSHTLSPISTALGLTFCRPKSSLAQHQTNNSVKYVLSATHTVCYKTRKHS